MSVRRKYKGVPYQPLDTEEASSRLFKSNATSCTQFITRTWKRIYPDGSALEAKNIISIAWALIVTSFLQFFMQSTSVIMCGHLSAVELDSVALSNSLISVTGVHIIGGMSTAFDTFFSQCYGAGQKKAVGVYLQRAFLLAYLVLFCVYCIHLNIEPILVLIGQDKIKALMAANYITYLLPGLFFDFTFQTLAKYLQNQGLAIPPLLCALAGNIVNVASQYVAIFVYGNGYIASAICQSVSFSVMVICELIYIFGSGIYKETWDGWKMEALKDWGLFMRLALPGILLIAFEAWCFEIGILIAGLLDTVQMGAQAIIFQVEGWTFMFPFGFSIAISIRVGQKLGAGDITGASIAYRVALSLMLVINLIITAIVLIFLRQLPTIFTNNQEVVDVAANVLPIFAFSHFFVGIAHVTSGALRGCGRQLVGAVTVFVCYYIICLPISISLTLATPLKVFGFWLGLATATVSETIVFVLFFVFRINWEQEVEKAQQVASVLANQEDKRASLGFNDLRLRLITSSDSGSARRAYESVATTKDRGRSSKVSGKLVRRRLSTATLVGLAFVAAVLCRVFVPKTWRPECMAVNNETVLISSPPLSFCNHSDVILTTVDYS